MPAIAHHDGMGLERREWRNTVGQSGMTPTAFAFLVPVFVVVFFAPFLCVFCVRRRQRATPLAPTARKVKKPALRRAEARERLKEFTDVADISEDGVVRADGGSGATGSREETSLPTTTTNLDANTNIQPSTPIADTASASERECAICLSALYAPAPPAPALLPNPTLDSAAVAHPSPTSPSQPSPPSSPEPILKLHSCAHTFHAECLVSWFVLRKTTCPICRTQYISTEDMKAYEDAEAAEMEQMSVADEEAARPAQEQQTQSVSNWRYFWAGQSVLGRENGGQAVRREGDGVVGETEGRMTRWWRIFRHG